MECDWGKNISFFRAKRAIGSLGNASIMRVASLIHRENAEYGYADKRGY